jgi:phosphoribosyl 1,2-cyclic phosphate phosphodiesterase
MELLLLGTAAADAYPAPYCDCPSCTEARRRGGPNLRSHSGALIDDDLKVDYGPSTKDHMQKCGRSLSKVRSVIITHQHPDHLYAVDFKRSRPPYTKTPNPDPLVVYGNEYVLAEINRTFPDPNKWMLDLRLVKPHEPFTTPTGDTILPLPAAHEVGSVMYRVTRGGKTIWYGHDSGIYPDATIQALGDGVPVDVALFDCTHGPKPSRCEHHMNFEAMLRMIDLMRQRGAVTDKTRLIATHFTHNSEMLHEEIVRWLLPHGVEVAYDGMKVTL